MASAITNVKVNDIVYGVAPEYIIGTQTATTASWTGVTKDTELMDGKVIVYYLPQASASSTNVTLNLTLSDENNTTTGAIPCYFTGSSRLTTHYGAGTHMTLIYHESGVGSVTTAGWWLVDKGYDTNTVTRLNNSYFRPYAGSALYRYKLCALDKDNRIQPITTTNQTSGTIVTKTPNTVALRPYKIWYYNTTTNVSAGNVLGAGTLDSSYAMTVGAYNFNSNIATYRMVYLRGTYDRSTDLFTLDSGTSVTSGYWTEVPTNTANITLSTYFTSGKYYWLVGGSYSSANYIQLFEDNPLYYFDGINLIPVETKVARDIADIVSSTGIYFYDDDYNEINGTDIQVVGTNGISVTLDDNTEVDGRIVIDGSNAGKTYTGTSPITVSGTAISHADSGATAGSYGSSSGATLAHSGTFTVPYVTVDAKGHVTAIANKAFTLPAAESSLPAGVQKVFYGTCSTAADTAAKVVACTSFTSSDLTAGTVIFVDFTYAQTASSCTLNINSTEAKTAYKYGTTAVNSGTWAAGQVVGFIYDGTYWNICYQADTNTDTKVTQAAAITTAGAYPIILAYSTATTSVTNTVNKSSSLTYNPSTKALVTGGTVDGINVATHTHSLTTSSANTGATSLSPTTTVSGTTSTSGTFTILTITASTTVANHTHTYVQATAVGTPQ